MKAIETHGIVHPDGQLSVRVPPDIAPGEHKVVVVIDEEPTDRPQRSITAFPVIDPGPWPADLSLKREDIYGDDGR